MFHKELGIIGIGKIGTALLRVLTNSKAIDTEKIIIYDIDQELLQNRSKELKVDFAESSKTLVKEAKYILIAVLPQVIDEVLKVYRQTSGYY